MIGQHDEESSEERVKRLLEQFVEDFKTDSRAAHLLDYLEQCQGQKEADDLEEAALKAIDLASTAKAQGKVHCQVALDPVSVLLATAQVDAGIWQNSQVC